DRALADEFAWRVKQAGHLNSKMRLMTAPWTGLLADDVWLRNARHANALAERLAPGLCDAAGPPRSAPGQTNGVFVALAPSLQQRLRDKGWRFYTFLGDRGCRLMCAWDTTPETVDRFTADLRAAAAT